MPDFSFVWFTYGLDHSILLRSVAAVRHLFPGCPLIVVDDASGVYKLPKRTAATLRKMGATVLFTTVPRRGNLRGWKCARIIAITLQHVQQSTGCKVVVKIDSDALMLRRTWLDAFLRDEVATYAGVQSKCGRAICGPTYALKPEAIKILVDSYVNDMESPYLTEEDFEMCSRLWRHYGGKDAHMMQVSYAMKSDRDAMRSSQAGMFCWNRNILQEHKVMLKWDEIVFGYRRLDAPSLPGLSKEAARDKWEEYVEQSNAERAKMMKMLWKMHLQQECQK